MEVLERVTAGAPLRGLAPVLPLGIATQTLVALLAATLIRLLLRTADRVAAALDRLAPLSTSPIVTFATPRPVAIPLSRHLSAAGVRGPPPAA